MSIFVVAIYHGFNHYKSCASQCKCIGVMFQAGFQFLKTESSSVFLALDVVSFIARATKFIEKCHLHLYIKLPKLIKSNFYHSQCVIQVYCIHLQQVSMKENYYWNGISWCCRTRSYWFSCHCHSLMITSHFQVIAIQYKSVRVLFQAGFQPLKTESSSVFLALDVVSFIARATKFIEKCHLHLYIKLPKLIKSNFYHSQCVIQVYCIHLQQVSMKENYYWNGISRYRCRRTRSYRSARHCHSIPGLMWLIRLRKNPGTEEKNSTGTLKEGS